MTDNKNGRRPEFRSFALSGSSFALIAYFVLLTCWFGRYFHAFFTATEVPAVDLSGHVQLVSDLSAQLPWRVVFYDHNQFSGWPAFQFYAFLTHLLAALIAGLLALFVDDSARLAVYLVMVFSAALLPAALFYFTKPIIKEIAEDNDLDQDSLDSVLTLLAYACGAFGFWFLNHDGQWHGIGAAASMNIGLFSHGTGLLLLLVNAGALFRLILAKSDAAASSAARRVAASFAALFLVHTLTALAALAAGVFSAIWYIARRRAIVFSYCLGLGLTAFWTIPHLAFSQYVPLDIIKPEGDFLALFFRYPAWWLLRGIAGIGSGAVPKIDPTNLIVPAVLAFMLLDGRVRKSRLIIPFLVFILVLILFTSSGFVAQSIPLGLHYYRFIGYSFLLLAGLIASASVVPAIVPPGTPAGRRKVWLTAITFVIAAAQVLLPHNERSKIAAKSGSAPHVDEQRVLEYFRSRPEKGRVMFQYFNDYKKYPWLDAHYLPSHLAADSGFEPLNGLFIQSSLAYMFPAGSAGGLGLGTFSPTVIYLEHSTIGDQARIEQLRRLGVTDLVVGDDKVDRLRPHAAGPVEAAGPYRIVPIAAAPRPLLEPVNADVAPRLLVGYRDLAGSLPFIYLEYYFYSRSDLYADYELVDLGASDALPAGLDALLINSKKQQPEEEPWVRRVHGGESAAVPLANIGYKAVFPIDHYRVWYQDNYQFDQYQAAARFLDQNGAFKQMLFERKAADNRAVPAGDESFSWTDGGQQVEFSGLRPGRPYLFNYSYFPYWQSFEGAVLRASAERIVIIPTGDKMTITYRRWNFFSSWCGLIISAASALFYCFYPKKPPRAAAR